MRYTNRISGVILALFILRIFLCSCHSSKQSTENPSDQNTTQQSEGTATFSKEATEKQTEENTDMSTEKTTERTTEEPTTVAVSSEWKDVLSSTATALTLALTQKNLI